MPAPGGGPCILAGDFNATLEHAQFLATSACRQAGTDHRAFYAVLRRCDYREASPA
jgi:endonuclease/exonuclease/phosphatase (EEP) superfamily protein YafD